MRQLSPTTTATDPRPPSHRIKDDPPSEDDDESSNEFVASDGVSESSESDDEFQFAEDPAHHPVTPQRIRKRPREKEASVEEEGIDQDEEDGDSAPQELLLQAQPTRRKKFVSYECLQCFKMFKSKAELKSHLTRADHRPADFQNEFRCSHCDKSFAMKYQLSRHTKTHTGEKNHACDFCSKTFVQAAHLTTHLRTHTGEKPYKCRFCDMGFRQIHSRIVHERTHTGEKPFECKVCGKGFAQAQQLKTHERMWLAVWLVKGVEYSQNGHECRFLERLGTFFVAVKAAETPLDSVSRGMASRLVADFSVAA
ncbi:hypothetical protein HDU98_009334 [Podochytrium sp. JEL0797]|nr:hypothetical protein HDU98_009334 [Podochytrium sp. JEL0797]